VTGLGSSVVLLRPMTDAARAWADENLVLDQWQWFGGAIAIEHRYVENIVEGIRGDGMEVR
jgi:hypothetical protein